jgi:cytochrome c
MSSILGTTLFMLLSVSVLSKVANNVTGDSIRGKVIYAQRCTSCHSIEFNGAGPLHRNLLGRKAGAVADYSYSPALKSSKIIWSNKTIDKWLLSPNKFIPGQKMWVSVPDAKDRQDIIAYLKTEGDKSK